MCLLLPPFTYVFAAAIVVFLLYRERKQRNRKVPLPPGPPADPLINHLRVIPTKDHPEVYYEWTKTYGDVVYLSALGLSFVILGSEQAAIDLLEKRPLNYSDRPEFPMHDLIGWTDNLNFLSYGEQFHKMRKLSQQPFTRQGCLKFREIQIQQTHVLLKNLLGSPHDFDNHAVRFATAIITDIAYGHRIVSDDDPYVRMADQVAEIALQSGNFGTNLVDIFPILKNLPSWFPGAWFIRFGEDARKIVQRMRDWPFQEVQQKLAVGTARTSFLSMHLEDFAREGVKSPKEFQDLKVATSLLSQAGGETTSSSLLLFIFAMLRHPEAQKKAQEEIDRVVGKRRLPDFSDRELLPMVECVMQETFRLYHPIPLGVPHRSREDDVYNGMFIPKGSIVVANAMSMSYDEKIYADPHRYWPERYLPKPHGNGEPYPTSMFGFGRRVCPGKHLADASLWAAMSNILATFQISPTRDEHGNDIVPPREFDTGATRRPKPFKCEIRVRNPAAETLIQNAYQDMLRGL